MPFLPSRPDIYETISIINKLCSTIQLLQIGQIECTKYEGQSKSIRIRKKICFSDDQF